LLDSKPWDEYFPSKERQLADEVKPSPFPANGSLKFYKGHFDWAALDIKDEEMGDAKVVSWAEAQLSKPTDKPLFLAVGIYRPHIPWYVPKSYFDLYPKGEFSMPIIKKGDLDDVPVAGQRMARRDWHQWMLDEGKWEDAVRGYLASVSFADAMVGRLINALDSGPLARNTIVVLWSDHGYHLGQKEHWEKFALWEQTTRVPLIISAPGMNPGTQCERPVSLIDIYPTLSELCGTPAQPGLEGTSLVPSLRNPDAFSDRAVITTQGRNNHAVSPQNWRFVQYADGSMELYEHQKDPNEFTNLALEPEFQSVIDNHRNWLPENNAEPEPSVSLKKK
jgi:arylsulfatase A-like enzyme